VLTELWQKKNEHWHKGFDEVWEEILKRVCREKRLLQNDEVVMGKPMSQWRKDEDFIHYFNAYTQAHFVMLDSCEICERVRCSSRLNWELIEWWKMVGLLLGISGKGNEVST